MGARNGEKSDMGGRPEWVESMPWAFRVLDRYGTWLKGGAYAIMLGQLLGHVTGIWPSTNTHAIGIVLGIAGLIGMEYSMHLDRRAAEVRKARREELFDLFVTENGDRAEIGAAEAKKFAELTDERIERHNRLERKRQGASLIGGVLLILALLILVAPAYLSWFSVSIPGLW